MTLRDDALSLLANAQSRPLFSPARTALVAEATLLAILAQSEPEAPEPEAADEAPEPEAPAAEPAPEPAAPKRRPRKTPTTPAE